jgi:PhzF family phenazine biosynthesis protein
MKTPVHIVNAFTHGNTGGNPAGVVLNADSLSAEQKLSIARQVNLSETAFLSQSSNATLKAEFFTPTRQIPHCGHATVAAFSLCRQLGLIGDGTHTKESIDGILTVTLKDGLTFLHQPSVKYKHLSAADGHWQAILDSLQLPPSALLDGAPLCVARAANAFLLIPLRDENTLCALQPRQGLIHALSEELDVVGFYPFVAHGPQNEFAASTRMFAPRYGITEESATGTAAGPLGCYLNDMLGRDTPVFRISQGRHMPQPSPSLLVVEVETSGEYGTAARVGGEGAQVEILDIAA